MVENCKCSDASCNKTEVGKLKTFNSDPTRPIETHCFIDDCPKRVNLEIIKSLNKSK